MTTKLEDFEIAMRAEHETLTKTFETAQVAAEGAWLEAEKHAEALTAFRTRYGHVLRALETKAVTVTTPEGKKR